MGTFFTFLYKFNRKFRIPALITLSALILSAGWFGAQIRFSEDITKIFPNNRSIKKMNFVYNNAKFLDKVVFMVSLKDTNSPANPALLVDFANRFTDSLTIRFVPSRITSVTTGPDSKQINRLFDEVYHNLPLFLDSNDYQRIDSLLADSTIKYTLEKDYRTLLSPAGFVTKRMIKKDPLNLTFIALNKFKKLQVSNNFSLYKNHILTKDYSYLLFFITPAHPHETAENKLLFEHIDALLASILADSSNLGVSYFGSAVVAEGNARQIKKDIELTVSIAAIALILLISLFFRNWRSFFIIMLPVLFGGLIALAGLALLEREVSAISLGIGSILLGISVDYALHVYAHFKQFGHPENILKQLSTPILLSTLTTSSAFLSLLFINSKVLNDLGIFAAISVFSAALFTLMVLPHLFSKNSELVKPDKNNFISRMASIDLSKKRMVILGVVAVTILFTTVSHKVVFKADMNEFNYMTKRTANAEKLLNKLTGNDGKPILVVSTGKTLNEAIQRNEAADTRLSALKEKGVLPAYGGSSVLFPSKQEQEKRIATWKTFWKNKKDKTIALLEENGEALHFKRSAFSSFITLLDKKYQPVKIQELPVIKSIFSDNLIETNTLCAVINVVHAPVSKLPEVEKSFQNHPGIWVINRQSITQQVVAILKDNLNTLVWFSIIVIFIILLIAYGRIELTLITMVPVVLSWFWVTGIMALAGISFNIFNIIIITFIFGLGIDYSIFLMRGMLLNYKFGKVDQASYRVSILLSVVTTLLGIGVLIFAKHPALKSIALMSIIGILSVVLITFSIEPVLFRWLTTYSKGKRKRPITLLDFVFSIWSGILFIGGGALLSVIAGLLQTVPGNDKKKKLFFHKLLKYSTKALIYSNFLSPKKFINPHHEDFSKPAIIIANHQSHIDLMILMLQTHKVAVFTNQDNYNNKVYGKALKYAGFIPAYTGHEDATRQLTRLVNEGYSLAIFPEGHRTEEGHIKRFHKGAFYLAEKLNLDIIPMVIHGPNEMLKKSELFLKRGKITVKIYPRLSMNDNQWGSDLREKKHTIQEWFRGEYATLKEKAETTSYLAGFIKMNYIYKGPVLEWYTKIKIKLESNYRMFDEIIPRQAVITDLGCGYGYLDFMLSLRSEQRVIHGFDYDEDKIKTAANCALANNRCTFSQADITHIEMPPSDVFILNDVLHYLPEHKQKKVVEKCIKSLQSKGMVIIRDGNKELKKRHKGTRMTELFSTKTGFNKTEHELEFISESMIREWINLSDFELQIIDKTQFTSNIVFLITKKQ